MRALRHRAPSALALLCAAAFLLPAAAAAAPDVCATTARRAPGDARIRAAVQEAHRQHELFGRQTIERNGGMFRVGRHEAEWALTGTDRTPAWERVATFWRALSETDPETLSTTAGRVQRSDAAPSAGGRPGDASRPQVAAREALLRAAIVDTPWSAAFISYLMRTAGFAASEFHFSDGHADYVHAAFETSAAETTGGVPAHVYRACDLGRTPPRAGDLMCATRASTAGTARFEELAAAMAARRLAGQAFPMHCDLVVRSDHGGDAKVDTIGGNVIQSVTLSRMSLNARKVLSDAYITMSDPEAPCIGDGRACRGHLSRRPWVVLLQFRH